MASKNDQAKINGLVETIAKSLLAVVAEETNGKKWESGFLDARGVAESTSPIMKVRIKLADGTMIKSAEVSMDQARALARHLEDEGKVARPKMVRDQGVRVSGRRLPVRVQHRP